MKLPLILLTTVLWSACGGLPEPGPALRPEHPRPALERAAWLNLNGVWAFRPDPANEGLAENWAQDPPRFASSMRVPFPWQTGDAETASVGWYRRAFTVPSDWPAQTVWLHTEGIGGEAQIWIGGKQVGSASSGFHPAEFDVTDVLSPGAESEIIVRVEDGPNSTQSGLIGTVWLEGRPRTYISALDFRTIPDGNSWALEARVAVRSPGATADVTLNSSDPDLGAGSAAVTIEDGSGEALIRLAVSNAQLWSPESPNLYPLTIRVTGSGDEADVVQSAVGLRTIEQDGRRVLINGQPQYFRGIAAPSGVAESDENLRASLERIKTLGFNLLYAPSGIEPRMHYWANQLGLWTLAADDARNGPSALRGIDIEVSETGSAVGARPLLISVGPQPEEGLAQFLRDFTNRVRRMDFAQGYIWGAAIPDGMDFGSVVPDMTTADLQGADYVGIDGASSFEARPGDKLTLHPFVSRFSASEEPLTLQIALRAVNDLGGAVQFFSTPRQITLSPGDVAPLEEIVMNVPQSRPLSGALAFELLDSSGKRLAANYALLLVRATDAPISPRSDHFAPRRTALRVEPRDHDGSQPVEYSFALSEELLAARPIRIEVLAEISASPAGDLNSVVRATLNGRLIGELTLPDAPEGPAAFLGDGPRYGYLANLGLDLSAEDLASLRDARALSLRLEPVTGGFTVFGERSGRYVIDPTLIVVTENVPGSANGASVP